MDLILFTMNKLKEIVIKFQNLISFIMLNYLPDYDKNKFDPWFFFK